MGVKDNNLAQPSCEPVVTMYVSGHAARFLVIGDFWKKPDGQYHLFSAPPDATKLCDENVMLRNLVEKNNLSACDSANKWSDRIDQLVAENEQLKETEVMLRGLIGEAEEMLIRVISERDAAKEREQWIHDNSKTVGGGHGFTVTFFVPVDHEDIFCGISEAIKLEQK